MAKLTLVIGNKNYSSWSMRPWVLMRANDIGFEEVQILLRRTDSVERKLEYSPAGRVPVLIDGELPVWDSLAIFEYLAEEFPEKQLWPQGRHARALARSVSAEMHSGFEAIRTHMPMNTRARYPGKGRGPGVEDEHQPPATEDRIDAGGGEIKPFELHPLELDVGGPEAGHPQPGRRGRPDQQVGVGVDRDPAHG